MVTRGKKYFEKQRKLKLGSVEEEKVTGGYAKESTTIFTISGLDILFNIKVVDNEIYNFYIII